VAEIDREELRRLAERAAWTGCWYDGGCNTVMCDYNGKTVDEHDEIAHPCQIGGVVEFIAAANPAAILALLDELGAAHNEILEQARLNGMGSEREAALLAEREQLSREVESLRRDAERYRGVRRIANKQGYTDEQFDQQTDARLSGVSHG
jgi:hypothetical protein